MLIWRSGSQRSLGKLFESWFGSSSADLQSPGTGSEAVADRDAVPPPTSRAAAERKPG